jgi:hypothetical protein
MHGQKQWAQKTPHRTQSNCTLTYTPDWTCPWRKRNVKAMRFGQLYEHCWWLIIHSIDHTKKEWQLNNNDNEIIIDCKLIFSLLGNNVTWSRSTIEAQFWQSYVWRFDVYILVEKHKYIHHLDIYNC